MEQYDQGYGCILYRTTLPAGPEATLEAKAVHDIGQVFMDGKRIGIMDRRSSKFSIRLPQRKTSQTLDVLVEAMGRVNFGAEVHDRKGLHEPVKLHPTTGQAVELINWQVFTLPFDDAMRAGLRFGSPKLHEPAFWRASLNVSEPHDTFLDMRTWSKGFVWVNGHNLGRFWNIGPQQTMYLPGPWLKRGENEVLILDLFGPEKPLIAGLEQPILTQLRPELDFARAKRPEVTLQLDAAEPVLKGSFTPGTAMQELKFARPARGRYFCLESLNAQDGTPYAAVAELELLDASGNPLSHEGWTIGYVDSEEREREDGTAENAIDGQTANFWHTQWGSASPEHPHRLVLDLGQSHSIGGFRYVPRQGGAEVGGRLKDYRVYIGDNLILRPKG
jgi:beta-galactosidase